MILRLIFQSFHVSSNGSMEWILQIIETKGYYRAIIGTLGFLIVLNLDSKPLNHPFFFIFFPQWIEKQPAHSHFSYITFPYVLVFDHIQYSKAFPWIGTLFQITKSDYLNNCFLTSFPLASVPATNGNWILLPSDPTKSESQSWIPKAWVCLPYPLLVSYS